MKKIVTMLLALLVCASALSACGAQTKVPAASEPAAAPSVEATEPTVQTEPKTDNPYIGKTFTGKGMSPADTSGEAFRVVDVELTITSPETADVKYPMLSFAPTFTVAYSLDGSTIILGECQGVTPSESFQPAWGGVARKTFILNEDGTMTASPAVEEVPAPAEEETEEPRQTQDEPTAQGTPVGAKEISVPANSIWFDYAYSMMGQEIADTFYADAAAWYPNLGTAAYTPEETEDALFDFTGTWCVITLYKNGTYRLTSAASEYIKDSGTWSWENYQLTLVRDKDTENPIIASILR